jgi:hypothetical protein
MKTALVILALFLAAATCFASTGDDAPLVAAARTGDLAGIRQAIAHGADLNALYGGNSWTPLMHAIHKGQLASVNALLAAGADPNRRGASTETALMMAAGYGYTDIVQALLRRGANPALIDSNGETAVDYAVAGANDIDRFTLFSCQDDTVRALHTAAPQLKSHGLSLRVGKIKRCASTALVQ